MKSIYVLDASGFLYRSYHAIANLTNNKGESTNALYGFIRSVQKLFKDFHPDHVVAVFDGPRGTIRRKEFYPEYKAHRTATPEDLRYQIGWAQDFCDLLGIPKLVIPEVEADDTMGSIAKWAGDQGVNVFLCTSDKDMAQLVNDHVSILNTHKDNFLIGKSDVEKVYGIPPEQVIDFLAITGDASDNIPGLPGFGPKTAITLLQQYGSLKEIYANAHALPKKKKETIEHEGEKGWISQKLVTIDTNVTIPHDESFYSVKEPQRSKLREFYTYMNFISLLKDLQSQSPQNSESGVNSEINKSITNNNTKDNTNQNANDNTNDNTNQNTNGPTPPLSYELIDDEIKLNELIQTLSNEKEICFDTETTGLKPLEAELVGIGFCITANKAWYIPVNCKLGLNKVITSLKPLFENSKIGFYGHNTKYDWHILRNYNITIANICFDTIIASYLLNSHSRQHSLDYLSLTYFGKVKIAYSDLVGKGKNEITLEQVPIEKVCEYCCEDVDYTFRLKQILADQLKERQLEKLFYELELPLLTVLGKMEQSGIFMNIPLLKTMGIEVNQQLESLEREIHNLAGGHFNIKSPKQLGEILFDQLKLSPPKKTTTGYSTDAEVLDILQNEHPIINKIIEFRTLEKLRSTYIETLPNEVNPSTHRIHPTFNQSGTATGRLSCSDPNLQNIPVRTPMGSRIREAFCPQKDHWSYLSADYSQIELRLVAHFSEDPTMLQAFAHNEDIHTHTAATILNIPIDQVTKIQRHQAKAVNFGIIYGQQAYGLSKELGISIEDAKKFIDTYFQRYSRVRDFLQSCKEKARATGKAVTLTGRERQIPEINSKTGPIRSAAERLAINTPLQGTAADLIKMAMLDIDKKLKNRNINGYMVLQIHDELIFEIPDTEIPMMKEEIRQSMENVYSLKVPLIVDISLGKNWKEC